MAYRQGNQWNVAQPEPGDEFPCGTMTRLLAPTGSNRGCTLEYHCRHCGKTATCRLSDAKSGHTTRCPDCAKKRYRESIEASLDRLNSGDRREIMRRLRVEGHPRADVERDYRLTPDQLNTMLRLEISQLEKLPEATKSAIAEAIVAKGERPGSVARRHAVTIAGALILASRVKRKIHGDLVRMQKTAVEAVHAVSDTLFKDRRGKTHVRRYEGELEPLEITVSKNRRSAKGKYAECLDFIRRYHRLIHRNDKGAFRSFINLVDRTLRGRERRSQIFLQKRINELRTRQRHERDAAIAATWAALAA